jgi:hypothetical protein
MFSLGSEGGVNEGNPIDDDWRPSEEDIFDALDFLEQYRLME